MDELAGLADAARKLALERFRLLQPHLEQNQPLRAVALAAGMPYRTAHRWLAQYRLFGLVALARKKRDDRGERRAVSLKIKEAIEGLALQKPPLPIAALYRQARRLAQDLGETAPSYSVVYDIVRRLPADTLSVYRSRGPQRDLGAFHERPHLVNENRSGFKVHAALSGVSWIVAKKHFPLDAIHDCGVA